MDNRFKQNLVFVVVLHILSTLAVQRESCESDEASCSDSFCIRAEQVCDGMIHCPDGSDELLDRCKNTTRAMFPIIFHCSVVWTRDLYTGVCPDVCRERPDYCAYALLAETGAPGTCKLPPYPKNGDYNVEDRADARTDSFSLYYYCDGGYDLEGDSYIRCENGMWLNKHPTCKPVEGSAGVDEDDLRR